MRLKILGSGGFVSVPRPLCSCKICSEARRKGIKAFRTGPSMFLFDHNILFDTPPELRIQLLREGIRRIDHVFITHSHPDHILGLGTLQEVSFAMEKAIPLYMSRVTFDEIKKRTSLIRYLIEKDYVHVNIIENGGVENIGNLTIRRVGAKENVSGHGKTSGGFLVENRTTEKKILYVPCDLKKMEITKEWINCTVAILEMGWVKNPKINTEEWQYSHISFEEVEEIIKTLNPKKVIFTHISTEEIAKMKHSDLQRYVTNRLGPAAIVAYDGLTIDI